MSAQPQYQEVPLDIVGSSTYGRYKKISAARTFNMFVSDGQMVNYAGYKSRGELVDGGEGRGIFRSVRGNFMLAVISQVLVRISSDGAYETIGPLGTGTGEVIMDENLNGQVCIVDGNFVYIYNDSLKSLTLQTGLPSTLQPNYVAYHNTQFLIGNRNGSADGALWYSFVTNPADATQIQLNSVGGELALENKPDVALAVIRLPGKGNNVMVLGYSVGAYFTQVGGLLNYQRSASVNVDYGVVSSNTIAASDEIVCWLSQNETNSPVIMVAAGGAPERISSDGIDHFLDQIQHPDQSTAFFYRQDGHLFYQLTFFHPDDNATIVYDFTAKKFCDLIDENHNYNPMRQIVHFGNTTYGVSINDGKLYEISTDYTDFDYGDRIETIPRIRITSPVRFPGMPRFRINRLSLMIEQGTDPDYFALDNSYCDGVLVTEDGLSVIVSESGVPLLAEGGSCLTYRPRVDIRLSKNGAQTFSNIVSRGLNPYGNFQNRFTLQNMGMANEVCYEFYFWTRSRTVVGNATLRLSA